MNDGLLTLLIVVALIVAVGLILRWSDDWKRP